MQQDHSLYLFGTPRLEQSGQAVDVTSQKALACLSYLAVTQRAHTRGVLSSLLWSDMPEERSRANLRKVLSTLRKWVGDRLQVNRQSVSLVLGPHFYVDVLHLEEAMSRQREQLPGVIELYNGPFWEGMEVSGAYNFEMWVSQKRMALHDLVLQALQHLLMTSREEKDLTRAIDYGKKLLQIEPWHEQTHAQLMEMYASLGRMSAAIQQYEECRLALLEELGVRPDTPTQALYHAIRDRKIQPSQPVETLAAMSSGERSSGDEGRELPPFFQAGVGPWSDRRERAPCVGREAQLSRLEGCLDAVVMGEGGILFVEGSAGQGKTTLLKASIQRGVERHPELLVACGQAEHAVDVGEPFLPFRQGLEMLMGDVLSKWEAGVLSTSHARRLAEAMDISIPALIAHGAGLIGHFISRELLLSLLPQGERFSKEESQGIYQEIADQAPISLEQTGILTLYRATIQKIAQQRPLVLVLDDLHWADPSSCALLSHLASLTQECPLLLLVAYRSDEVFDEDGTDHPLAPVLHELRRRHGDIWLDLNRLEEMELRAFVDAYLETLSNRFDEDFRAALFRQTQGHPLFVTELVNDMLARGEIKPDQAQEWSVPFAIDWQALPSRLEGMIALRLERLDPIQKGILELACIQGNGFVAEVIAEVQQVAPTEIIRILSRQLDRSHHLVRLDGVQRIGGRRLSTYRFRHQLFQHYLYHRLDEAERSLLHEDVAAAMEAILGEHTGSYAGQLAVHYERASLFEAALPYRLQAGMQAFPFSANVEASQHFARGIALLTEMPFSMSHLPLKLGLYGGYAGALLGMRGFFDMGVEDAIEDVRQLVVQVTPQPAALPAYFSLFAFYFNTHRHREALMFAETLMEAAGQTKDPRHLVLANTALGLAQFNMAPLDRALPYLTTAANEYDTSMHGFLAQQYNLDFAATARPFLALVELLRGFPAQAIAHLDSCQALQLLPQPASRANIHVVMGQVFALMQRPKEAQEAVESVLLQAREYGLVFYEAFALFVRGWALSELGDERKAMVDIAAARAILAAVGGELLPNMTDAMSALVMQRSGRLDEALALLPPKNDDVAYDVFLPYYLLARGRLLEHIGAVEEAQDVWIQALEIAIPHGQLWFSLQLLDALREREAALSSTPHLREFFARCEASGATQALQEYPAFQQLRAVEQ